MLVDTLGSQEVTAASLVNTVAVLKDVDTDADGCVSLEELLSAPEIEIESFLSDTNGCNIKGMLRRTLFEVFSEGDKMNIVFALSYLCKAPTLLEGVSKALAVLGGAAVAETSVSVEQFNSLLLPNGNSDSMTVGRIPMTASEVAALGSESTSIDLESEAASVVLKCISSRFCSNVPMTEVG